MNQQQFEKLLEKANSISFINSRENKFDTNTFIRWFNNNDSFAITKLISNVNSEISELNQRLEEPIDYWSYLTIEEMVREL